MSNNYVSLAIPEEILELRLNDRISFERELKDFLESEIKENHLDLCADINTGEIGTIDGASFSIENLDLMPDGKGTIDYSIFVEHYMGCKDLDGSDWEYGAIHFEFRLDEGTIRIERHEVIERDTYEEY
jgi:hypothetical protein